MCTQCGMLWCFKLRWWLKKGRWPLVSLCHLPTLVCVNEHVLCLRLPNNSSSWSSSSTRSTCSSSRSRSAPLTTLTHLHTSHLRDKASTWADQKPELFCKVCLSCPVPAGEHALRDDPGFPHQHPVPPGHLWPPDDPAIATNPLQARSVI